MGKNARFREQNNNWRGGRSIASNGYVLIRVGKDHHLADGCGGSLLKFDGSRRPRRFFSGHNTAERNRSWAK